MAGKSRRAAARQGELSRRRKRGQRGPSGIPTSPASGQQQNGGGTAVAVGAATDTEPPASVMEQDQPVPATAAAPAARPSPQPARPRGQGRLRGERPAAYNYVGAELRRIAVLSSAVIAALVVLSVVL